MAYKAEDYFLLTVYGRLVVALSFLRARTQAEGAAPIWVIATCMVQGIKV